jgi:hypothetical protein
MMMYQIFTEDRNRNKIIKVLNSYLKNYTLLFGEGMWRGEVEPCITIQFIPDVYTAPAQEIANEIKKLNSQQSVLLVEHQSTEVLVN